LCLGDDDFEDYRSRVLAGGVGDSVQELVDKEYSAWFEKVFVTKWDQRREGVERRIKSRQPPVDPAKAVAGEAGGDRCAIKTARRRPPDACSEGNQNKKWAQTDAARLHRSLVGTKIKKGARSEGGSSRMKKTIGHVSGDPANQVAGEPESGHGATARHPSRQKKQGTIRKGAD